MYIDGYSLAMSKTLLWISALLIVLVLIFGWYGQSVYVACSSQSASYNALAKWYSDELEWATLLMNTIENVSYKNIDTISWASELDKFLRWDTRPKVVTFSDLVGEHQQLININTTILESASWSSDRYLEISRQIVSSSWSFDHLARSYIWEYNRCIERQHSLPFYDSLSEYYTMVFGWFDLDKWLPIE